MLNTVSLHARRQWVLLSPAGRIGAIVAAVLAMALLMHEVTPRANPAHPPPVASYHSGRDRSAPCIKSRGGGDGPLIVQYAYKWPGDARATPAAEWAGWGRSGSVPLGFHSQGVSVDKTGQNACPATCRWSTKPADVAKADAVVFEMPARPRASAYFPLMQGDGYQGIKTPPNRAANQLWYLFYFEPVQMWADYVLGAQAVAPFDRIVSPDPTSSLPVSAACPWGRSREAYLKPPGPKTPGNLIAYLGNSVDDAHKDFLNHLMALLPVESFKRVNHNAELPVADTLDKRITMMESYKFVIITETVAEDNWVGPDLYHALVAGAVPVYIGGAPNIADFSPGDGAIIDAKAMGPVRLARYIEAMDRDTSAYLEAHHAWRKGGLSPSFSAKLDQCVFYADCRICQDLVAAQC